MQDLSLVRQFISFSCETLSLQNQLHFSKQIKIPTRVTQTIWKQLWSIQISPKACSSNVLVLALDTVSCLLRPYLRVTQHNSASKESLIFQDEFEGPRVQQLQISRKTFYGFKSITNDCQFRKALMPFESQFLVYWFDKLYKIWPGLLNACPIKTSKPLSTIRLKGMSCPRVLQKSSCYSMETNIIALYVNIIFHIAVA